MIQNNIKRDKKNLNSANKKPNYESFQKEINKKNITYNKPNNQHLRNL